MRNCLIMGFGRSGTSLMGGILHEAGYFMGENLYPPRHSNPKGFFECEAINGINEKILMPYDYCHRTEDYPKWEKTYSPYRPGEGHRWISYIPSDTHIVSHDQSISESIKSMVGMKRFAYKDPRFNYTLDVWMPLLPEDTVCICMFRDPSETVESVLTECASADYLSDFAIHRELTEELWYNSYQHLLKKVKKYPERTFLFVHYNQLISGERMEHLYSTLQFQIDSHFVEPSLYRSRMRYPTPIKIREVYRELCDLAKVDAFMQ